MMPTLRIIFAASLWLFVTCGARDGLAQCIADSPASPCAKLISQTYAANVIQSGQDQLTNLKLADLASLAMLAPAGSTVEPGERRRQPRPPERMAAAPGT